MIIIYPKDNTGNDISFVTPEDFIYDNNGVCLTDKLNNINQRIDNLGDTNFIGDSLKYKYTLVSSVSNDINTISLVDGSEVISSINIATNDLNIPDTIEFDEDSNILYLKKGKTNISSADISGYDESYDNNPPSSDNEQIYAPVLSSISYEINDNKVTVRWYAYNNIIDVAEPTCESNEGISLLASGVRPNFTTSYFEKTKITLIKKTNYDNRTVVYNYNKGVQEYTFSGLSYDNYYCIQIRAYSTTGKYASYNTGWFLVEESAIIYGFHIDETESDPDAAVTYLESAVGMTPMSVKSNGGYYEFDRGSWTSDDLFFFPRPCMLKYDGTVDYYLDPNDYTKKEDGTDSDIFDVNYEGNAMMEFGRDDKQIWIKIVNDEDTDSSASIYIANKQVDSGYKAYSFIDYNGNLQKHFYLGIFLASDYLPEDTTKTIMRSYAAFDVKNYNNGKYANTKTSKVSMMDLYSGKYNENYRLGNRYSCISYADTTLLDIITLLLFKNINRNSANLEIINTYSSSLMYNFIENGDDFDKIEIGGMFKADAIKLFKNTDAGVISGTTPFSSYGVSTFFGMYNMTSHGVIGAWFKFDRFYYKLTYPYDITNYENEYNSCIVADSYDSYYFSSKYYLRKVIFDEENTAFYPSTTSSYDSSIYWGISHCVPKYAYNSSGGKLASYNTSENAKVGLNMLGRFTAAENLSLHAYYVTENSYEQTYSDGYFMDKIYDYTCGNTAYTRLSYR